MVDAIVWTLGPAALTCELVMQDKAETLFMVSNAKLTSKVVHGLEARGIAAYGPIFVKNSCL